MSEAAKSLTSEVLSALKEPLQDIVDHKLESLATGTAITLSISLSDVGTVLSITYLAVKLSKELWPVAKCVYKYLKNKLSK